MPKTNAQRQREYRQRHLKDVSDDGVMLERINMMVDYRTRTQLKRLASCYGVTQRGMLEHIIREAAGALIQRLTPQQQTDFYDMNLSLLRNGQETNRPPTDMPEID